MEQDIIRDAVVRNPQVLAESSQRISNEIKMEHSEVDWAALAGFRNILVHDYLGLDNDRVWNILVNDLPVMKQFLSAMLKDR